MNSTESTPVEFRAKLVLSAFSSSSFFSNSKSTSEMQFLAHRNVDRASLENLNPTYFPNTCASLVSCAGELPEAGWDALISTTACSNDSSFLFSRSSRRTGYRVHSVAYVIANAVGELRMRVELP